jgi:hypothetical protein
VRCIARDSSTNASSCTFTVTVRDLPPVLTVTYDSTNVLFCWPRTCGLFVLEGASDLTSSNSWTELSGPYPVSGNDYCVSVPATITETNRFFRLRSN